MIYRIYTEYYPSLQTYLYCVEYAIFLDGFTAWKQVANGVFYNDRERAEQFIIALQNEEYEKQRECLAASAC